MKLVETKMAHRQLSPGGCAAEERIENRYVRPPLDIYALVKRAGGVAVRRTGLWSSDHRISAVSEKTPTHNHARIEEWTQLDPEALYNGVLDPSGEAQSVHQLQHL